MSATAATIRKPERLPLLDGMRGIAALVVLNYHASAIKLTDPFFSYGYLFVDFFFLLSGFVLTLAFEPQLNHQLSTMRFLHRRIRRFWPVMAIGTIIGMLVIVQRGEFLESLPLLAMGLLFIPALDRDGFVFPINGPIWSLSFELLANAAHALIFVRLRRAALIAVVLVSGAILSAGIAYQGGNLSGATREYWLLGIPRVFFSYCFGILLARDRKAGRRLGRLRCRWTVAVILPVLAVLGLAIWPMPRVAGEILVTIVVLPACFACAINAELPARYVPLFTGLGLLSFPLYAVHVPILTIVSMNVSSSISCWLGPVAALLVAAAIAHVFEARNRQSSATAPRPISLGALNV